MHSDAERFRYLDDGPRYLDVGARGRGVAPAQKFCHHGYWCRLAEPLCVSALRVTIPSVIRSVGSSPLLRARWICVLWLLLRGLQAFVEKVGMS
jgi:hypothetical protein